MSTPYVTYRGWPIYRIRDPVEGTVYHTVKEGTSYDNMDYDAVIAWIDSREVPETPTPGELAGLEAVGNERGVTIYREPLTGLYAFKSDDTWHTGFKDYEEARQAVLDIVGLPPTIQTFDIKTIEAPGLPWYVAWLKPVLDYLGALAESIINYGKDQVDAEVKDHTVQAALNDAQLEAAARDLASGIELEPKTKQYVIAQTLSVAQDMNSSLRSTTEQNLEPNSETWKLLADAGLNPGGLRTQYGKGQTALDTLYAWRNGLFLANLAQFGLHAAIETGSLGQIEFMRDFKPMVITPTGIDELASRATMLEFEKDLLQQAEYEANEKYTPFMPTYADLINQVVKEVISLDDFKAAMKKQGFSEEWSQRIWDAHFMPPDWTAIRNAYYRGAISYDDLLAMKQLVDLDPRYDKVWLAQLEVIPPVSELTNQLVKEVISQETYAQYMKWYGYDPVWTQRIWDAHFSPPTLQDGLTAWRRGLIDEDRLDELMVIWDMDPRFKDIFDTRKYDDPTLSLTRFLYETGSVNEAEVRELVRLQGFRPQYNDAIANYILKFQERVWRRQYLLALRSGYAQGVVEMGELTKAVLDAGYSEGVAEWMAKSADIRKELAGRRGVVKRPKLLSISDLRKAYEKDLITEDDFRTQVYGLGYEIGEVDLLVRMITMDKVTEKAGGPKIALTQAELLTAWRFDELTEDALRTSLLLRGLAYDEVEMLIRTKKKQWAIGGTTE